MIGKIYDYLPNIVDVVWSRGLNLPNLDDFVLEIDLTSGEKRWRFQMSTVDNNLSWRQAGSRQIPKDCAISASIILGANALMRSPMRDFTSISRALPIIALGRYNAQLTPSVHSVAGFPVIQYTLSSQHARIYSKHRQQRGDASPNWREYSDLQGNPWEYLSGPGGKRMARISAGSKPIDVDASERSGESSSDTESSDADSNVTVDARGTM